MNERTCFLCSVIMAAKYVQYTEVLIKAIKNILYTEISIIAINTLCTEIQTIAGGRGGGGGWRSMWMILVRCERASISKLTLFIYLAFEKTDRFIY